MADQKTLIEKEEVVIRFSGDSGDGMQLTGTQFSNTSALYGNDVSTFPDYPAEIRAPQGTVGGVSGFQLHFGSKLVTNPGDYCDVLVAMNPAALKANLRWVKPGGTIIVNIDTFNDKNLEKAGYKENPIPEYRKGDYNIVEAPITTLTQGAMQDITTDNKSVLRTRNMFALGMTYFMFNRTLDYTIDFLNRKFGKKPDVAQGNKLVLQAGFNYAETIEVLASRRVNVVPAKQEKGVYRNINGNTATAWGLIAAAEKAKLELFCGSYPITPATDILIELAARKDLGVKTFQAEDEIAGICTAIGASFGGDLAVTSTSGPGLSLKSEAIGLAVMTELPLVVVNVQRGGPSTGLPTKTEQSDLYQALYGRNGECPAVVVAASTPSDCFKYAFESARIALEHMTPVILLTDGFIANGTEPWRIPAMSSLPEIKPPFAKKGEKYQPYARDTEKLNRFWAIPGTPGLEHRLGGLEKMNVTGTVSYVPENHDVMTNLREQKVKNIENYIPKQTVFGDDKGDLLVVSWGGTYGHVFSAVDSMRKNGHDIHMCHINYINPLPSNIGEIFSRYKRIVVCEINLGQLVNYLRVKHQDFKYLQYNKMMGLPFTVNELVEHFTKILQEK
ncbi:MAG: 2-oxoacid:acceptor oxidoreductase subunit alpha [Salinivirgaceae bacterium]|nr:2-oxoacid:acceptor oxidoreductase subunit alpha [Salinivirgaceae bacterium]MDD4746823.1 2-oxoacid:acceptor oxidoreductase subunit alpha [Salinivirgaceae bacterium]MDY0280863.1 2-oxoacid:acceptor oxidoreductase subunit alpha [Salinivirgaceae bacterium]